MISGLFIINKPSRISSHDVVSKLRRSLKIKKVGHYGTLDPLAKGVLLVAVGNATRFFDFHLNSKKQYSGLIQFGHATTTYDAEGEPVTQNQHIDLQSIDLKKITSKYIGKQEQTPPIYSAKKINGKAMYKYARENKAITPEPVTVEIYDFDYRIQSTNQLWFRTTVSSGTYIRSIAHDLGQDLGCGAYLADLIRERSGDYDLKSAIDFNELDRMDYDSLVAKMVPFNDLLPQFSVVTIKDHFIKPLLNGMPIFRNDIVAIENREITDYYKMLDNEGNLLSIAKSENESVFAPHMVFNT